MKIPRKLSESVNQRRPDITMAKRTERKGQTLINETIHIKLNTEKNELH